jgi:hypothetical protein
MEHGAWSMEQGVRGTDKISAAGDQSRIVTLTHCSGTVNGNGKTGTQYLMPVVATN